MRITQQRARDLAFALALFVLAAVALSIVHTRLAPHYKLSHRQVVAAVRAENAKYLAHHRITSVRTIPFDERLQEAGFFDGSRLMLSGAVDPSGHVLLSEPLYPGAPKAGARVANAPWLLALFTGVLLLALMVVPLKSLRNLDALALGGFTVNIAAVNAGLIALSVVVSWSLLAYLALRCLWVGLRHEQAMGRRNEVPLFEWLTRRSEPARRLGLLRMIVVAMGAAVLMITLTSTDVNNVASASLQGATDLLHGQLPYGHTGGIVHGDTYGLLNYILYLPGALMTPVGSTWDDASGALPLMALAVIVTAAGIWVLVRRMSGRDEVTSLRAVLAWLAFPPVVIGASSGTNDLVLVAILTWMLVLACHAGRSTLLLAMAIWSKVVPLVLLPLWLLRGRPERNRAVVAMAGLSLLFCGYLAILGGTDAYPAMLRGLSYQFTRGSFYAPWYTFSVQWLQPVVAAAVLTVLLLGILHIRRIEGVWRDPVRIAALCGAVLLGMQLGASFWPWRYAAWMFPFVLIALLVERAPPEETILSGAFEVEAPVLLRERQPELV